VSPVAPGLAVLAGLVLFLLPGLTVLSFLRAPRERFDEALFLAVAVSVMASAWMALLLAEIGRFSLLRGAAILAAPCAAALILGHRRLGAPLPRPRSWREVVPAAVVLAVALALQARPTEYLLGGRDPGTYVAAMAVIARTGGIAYTDPAVLSIPREDVELFFREPDAADYNWGRFMGFPLERPETGRVVPEFFHLFPAFGAYLFQAMGVKGALATPPVFGVLGTLAAFFAFRRIFGPAPALLAALLLAVNVVQVWFARYPVSEGLSQTLIFTALLAAHRWERARSAVFGVLTGAALGLSLLVRIDGVLVAAPLGAYLLVRRARGELTAKQAAAVLVPFAALAVHAALHAAFFARKYVVSIATRPYWHQSLAVWLLAAAAIGALGFALYREGPALVRRAEAHAPALRTGAALGLVVLALYACFLRPALSAWAGADGNDPARAVSSARGILDALGFTRLAAHDAQSVVRLGWFVTPLGLALGLLGLVAIVRDGGREHLFPVLTALSFSAFYFYKLRVYNDYFFALRRFVPVILPFVLGFAAYLLTRMAAAGSWRRLAAGVMALFLGASYLLRTAPLVSYVDWKGSVRFVADVARRFGPDDVVIFEQKESIHLLSLPLWAVHGVNVLELARFRPDPERLQHLIGSWRGRYRNIYFVHTWREPVCGVFLQDAAGSPYRFGTHEWERAYGRPPQGPEPRGLEFTISRVVPPEDLQVPALPEVDIGASDDFQVSGFFQKERDADGRTYRWTGPCAEVYLPAAKDGRRVTITASAGQRPESLPPSEVRVSLSGAPLGSFRVGPEWSAHTLDLPAAGIDSPPRLRLDVVDPVTLRPRTWRPARSLPGSDDTRDIGIKVDLIEVELGGASGAPPRPPARSGEVNSPPLAAVADCGCVRRNRSPQARISYSAPGGAPSP
jgi:hypothetical protein